jgi:diaminopimelate epimerase
MKFTKMHGIGNDYVYINCLHDSIPNPELLAVSISDRHFGVGSDGLVLILPSNIADFRMQMFNADGSEGRMCGNAIRCVGKYLYDRGHTDKSNLEIETLSGIKYLKLFIENEKVKSVQVDMGEPILLSKNIPVLAEGNPAVVTLNAGGKKWDFTCVSMGNPHAVTITNEINSLDLEKIGPIIEHSSLFPHQINTEFVKVITKNRLKMRVWERGSGETFACGTGACAAATAAILAGFADKDTDIEVELKGGTLIIKLDQNNHIQMTGTATFVFDGELL